MRQYKRHRADPPKRISGLFRRAAQAAGEADIQSRMRHNNQPELARPFQNAQIFRIIQIGLLIGRMNFDASHVPGGNAVKLLLPIHIIRMDAGLK